MATAENIKTGITHEAKFDYADTLSFFLHSSSAFVDTAQELQSAPTEHAACDEEAVRYWMGSSVNSDLAQCAELEQRGKIGFDDPSTSGSDFFRAPMYWQLRSAFVQEASAGSEYAFFHAVWRAYNAGRLSASRLRAAAPDVATLG